MSNSMYENPLKLTDPLVLDLLNEVNQLTQEILLSLANSDPYWNVLNTAFGDTIDATTAQSLQQQWQIGDFSLLPDIEIISESQILGARGAFSAENNKIYFSYEYLRLNTTNINTLVEVLLEEVAHWVDVQVNSNDAMGDEGEIFARVVMEETLSEQDLEALRSQNDIATVVINDQPIEVELNTDLPTLSADNDSFIGSLSLNDNDNPLRSGSFSDDYELINVVPGISVTVSVNSDDFDTYLQLLNGDTGDLIDFNDDFTGLNSQLTFTPQQGVNYVVRVTSFGDGETGEYTLNTGNIEPPDLTVTQATVEGVTTGPVSLVPGQFFDVSWTVENQGLGDINFGLFGEGNYFDEVYLSSDEFFDFENDQFLTDLDGVGFLSAGDSYEQFAQLSLPQNSSGFNYLLFVSDAFEDVDESDEDNNVLAFAIDVDTPDINLSVTDASITPTTVGVGGQVELSWEVTNLGTETSSGGWTDYFYLSEDNVLDTTTDTFITSQFVTSPNLPLAGGDSYNLSRNLTLPNSVGGNFLLVATDRFNEQAETDEDDNVFAIPIDITAANLTVTNAEINDLSANPITVVNGGETIQLAWTVENTGSVATNRSFWRDYFYLSDDEFFDNSDTFLTSRFIGSPTTSLDPNESYSLTQNITVPSTTTAGNRFLLFWSDRFNEQVESTQTDNIVAVPLEIVNPNLQVSSAQLNDTSGNPITSVRLGQSVNLSWTTLNSSIVEALGNWTDGVYISDDETFDSFDTFVTSQFTGGFTPLAAGDDYDIVRNNVTIPLTQTGDRFLLFVADSNRQQGETDEDDNVIAIPIEVNAPPIVGIISANNGTVSGDLNVNDSNNPTLSGRFSDDYTLVDYTPAELVTVELTALDYNPYVQIINADTQQIIVQDDNSGQGTNARLTFIPQAGINYLVRVSSSFSNQTGNYSLSVDGVSGLPLSTTLTDQDGFIWDIQQNGSINNGTSDAYDGGLNLIGFPSFVGAQTEDNDREIIIGSSANNEGLEISRKIYVPDDQSWARFLEIITNVSDAPINHTVDIETNFGSGSSTVVVASSDGDTTFTPEDNWLITDDSSDGAGDPTLLHLIAGPGGQKADRTSLSGDQLSYEYDLTVAPGETQIVMHLAAQNENRTVATTKAGALGALGLDLFAGMSESERQQLVNFVTEGLVIDDVVVVEGDNNNSTALFTVTLLEDITEAVTVDYETVAGMAAAGVDYISRNGSLTFLPGGERTQTIGVEIIADTIGEADETFFVNLSNASGSVIADGQGRGIINNDDLIPVDLELSLLVDVSGSVDNNEYNLQIAGYANIFDDPTIYTDLISRGIDGSVAVNLIVWSSSSLQQESIPWTLIDSVESSQAFAQDIRQTLLPQFGGSRPFSGGTSPGPAINFATPLFFNNDFDSRRQTIDVSGDGSGSSFTTASARDNALAAGIDVINGIVIGGSSSVFNFYQNSLIGGINSDGTPAFTFQANTFSEFEQVIRDKLTFEFTPPPKISIEDFAAFEGNVADVTEFVVTVTLDRPNDEQPITVSYSTENDTAIAGEDYTESTGIVTFAPGETVQTFILEVSPDTTPEDNETFFINLSNPTNADIVRGQGLITIINDDEPDLTITTATASQRMVSPGETLDTDWTVTNVGIEDAQASWVDSVYYSEDDTLSPGDIRLVDRGAGPLAAGDSYDRTQAVTIPFNVTAGNHFLLVQSDRQNTQEEFNENNNLTPIPIEVVLPDLVVNALAAPATANFGDTITLTWDVANLGTGSALGTWSDRLYLSSDETISEDDRLLVTEVRQNTLAPGESYTQSADLTLPLDSTVVDGTYFILAQTDALGEQAESDDNNNVNLDSIELTIPPLPDIVVSDIESPIEAFSGQDIEIAWTLSNQGNAVAGGTWTDQVLLSDDVNIGGDQLIESFEFTGVLEPGESITRRQVITLPVDLEGDRFVVVRTDASNQIFEFTGENNNTTIDEQVMTVELSPFPNLQVSSVTAPVTAFSSQETTIEWIVTNNGTGATSTPTWSDRVWLSLDQTLDETDTFLGQVNNPSFLNVGDSYSNSLTATLPQGIDNNYFFIVQTDSRNQVFEFENEGDNQNFGGPTDVMLTPPPDLQVTGVNAPIQAFSGQPMTLSWTVTNEGTGGTLESSWFDRIYLSSDSVLDGDDQLLGQQTRNGVLGAGESYTATREVTLPIGVSGDFFFIVQTDAGDQVFEQAFNGNNTGFDASPTTINLTPPPDLEVEFVNAPTEATASRTLSIDYRVTNFGATRTPNSFWRDGFYLSTDNQLDVESDLFLGQRTHVGALDIGEFYDATATFTLPNTLTGDFFVFMVTDNGNDVFELNKENNIASDSQRLSIVSRPADLIVSTATTSTSAKAGESIRVDWTVLNQGTGDTVVNRWTDRIVASVDGILGNGDDVTLGNFTRNGLLNVGESYKRSEVVSIPFSLVGDYNVFVVTDVGNSIYEASNESNNNFTPLPVTIIRETPDLQVTEVNIPATAENATIIPLSWTVENSGQGVTNSNFWYDQIFLSTDQDLGDDNDILLGRIRHNNVLAPGENYTGTANLLVPLSAVGDYYVIVRTDQDNQVLEDSLENNNDGVSVGQINITANPNPDLDNLITPRPGQPSIIIPPEFSPDLVVTSVEADDIGFSGQSLEVTWTVNNNRFNTGDRSWFDSVYLSRDQIFDRDSDILLGSRSRISLDAGGSYTTTANFSIPRGLAGPFYVFVATDSTNRINEPDGEFNNNEYDPNATEISLLPPADLVAGTITVPSDGSPGQSATLTYTVENQGTETALGRWTDSIYISADEQWDINDPLFAQVSVNGPIVGGDSYTETVTAALPGLISGDYHVIVRSDIRNNLPELNEENNLAASVDRFNLDIEQLLLDTPTTGTLGEDQAVYYRVDVEAGETLLVNFDSESVNGANELYIRYGEVPTRSEFDIGFSEAFAPDQDIVVPNTLAGSYYILAYGNDVPETTANFNIEADILEFSLLDISNDRGSNQGEVTVVLEGAKFTPETVVTLVDADGTEFVVSSTIWKDQTTLWSTLDLRGLATGLYDIRLEDQGQIAIQEDAFTVTNGPVGQLDVQLRAPSAVRPNQAGIVTITYVNLGETDIAAPLLNLSVENAQIRLPDTLEFSDDDLQFLGINTDGPAGVLAPGDSDSISVIFRPTGGDISFSVGGPTADGTIDWDAIQQEAQPFGVSSEAWDVIWQNYQASVGNTGESYNETLADMATFLSQLGISDANVLRSQLQQVSGYGVLFDRYNIGSFGRGVDFLGDLRTLEDEQGNVIVEDSGSQRVFQRQSDGSYRGSEGDYGTLTITDGIVELREKDGITYGFLNNGRLNSVEDSNGNRTTAEYDNNTGQIIRLVESNGDRLTFTYNGQGRIDSATDEDGRVTTYDYDSTGELLLTITENAGTPAAATTRYTYNDQFAIESVTTPDNVQTFYEYDERGFITEQRLTGNAETLTYSRDGLGRTLVTDALDASARLSHNESGQLVEMEDPIGRLTRYSYDSLGNLTQVIEPDGAITAFTYDDQGNLTRQIDGLGQEITFTYEPQYSQLQSFTDDRGNGLTYSYDNAGNLAAITYADGTQETFNHDSRGNVIESVNRRNQLTTYTYNAENQPLQIDYADGSSIQYTYDGEGNLISTTNATGTSSLTYDEAGRLLRMTDGAGRFLEFSYDAAGRRTQMIHSDGNTINYSYDSLGKLAQITNENGDLIIEYTYDAVGRLIREDNGNGTYSSYNYDEAGQLLQLTHYDADGVSINSQFDYTYDDLGRPLSMTTLDGEWNYTYDAIGQLTRAIFTSNDPSEIPDQDLSYEYDSAGNRIRTIENGVTNDYVANNLNQYTNVGVVTYEYDNDGNLISKTDGSDTWIYNYNDREQLVSVLEADGTLTEYEYDTFGNRSATIRNGQRTEYLVDPFGFGDVIGEYDGNGNLIAQYTHGLGLVSQTDANDVTYFYDNNLIGSTVGISGTTGDYVNRYAYLPFGENLLETETIANTFEFGGQFGVMEEENGLHFMRARYYDSSIGRFLSEDPIGLQGGDTNLYGYSLNSPTVYSDPSGNFVFVPVLVAAGVGALIGAGTDAAIQGTLIATGAQSEFSWTSLGVSAGLGAIGGGGTALARNTIVRGGSGFFSRAGNQFSHSIPNRTSWAPNWLLNWRRSPVAQLNGEFVSPRLHYAIDPFARGGSLIGGGSVAPVRNGLGWTRYPAWRRTLNRIPSWIWSSIAGGALGNAFTRFIRPFDPNDILGPEGFGEERWITATETLPYTIRFENLDTATAPAQEVVITHPLDPDVDPRTFRLGSFGWGGMIFEVPENRAFYSDRIDLTEEMGFVVDVFATIDVREGVATWTLTTIDPETGEQPEDALLGFLPPNNEDGVGDGFVTYTIRSDRDAQTGDIIDAAATIVFDTEEPIDTPPIFNTIDAVAPISTVEALPTLIAEEENGEFLVSWTGSDDEGGSAIGDFDIYVSENGGAFTLWLEDTNLTEAVFIGQPGTTYGFYSVAQDNAGNLETRPTQAQAVTQVAGTPPNESPVLAQNNGLTLDEAATATITNSNLAVTDGDNASDELVYTITVNPLNGSLLLDGTSLILGNSFTQEAIENNVLSYVHDGSETVMDSFSFTVSDGADGTIEETSFDITVNPVNDLPILAVNAGLTVDEGATGTIATGNLQVNDVDSSVNELTYDLIDLPTHGTLFLNGVQVTAESTFTQFDVDSNLLIYQHNGSETLDDSFTFTVDDGAGGTIEQTSFDITVNPVNDLPVAVDDAYEIRENNVLTVDAVDGVLENDTDADLIDILSVVLEDNVSNGILTLDTDGSFEYTPNTDFTGVDTFTYSVNDGNNGTDMATVNITVNPIGDTPILGTDQQDDLAGTGNNDVIVGRLGADNLTGNGGSDTFVYESFRDGIDRITDFGTDDFIDLSSIFSTAEYSSATPFEEYVQLAQVGANTEVRVNPVGDIFPGIFANLVTLENATANDLTASNFLV